MKLFSSITLCLLTFAGFVNANNTGVGILKSPTVSFELDSPEVSRCHKSKRHCDNEKIVTQVQQRFYKFQDATSRLKQVGHAANPQLLQDALDVFISFIDPAFVLYQFDTIGGPFGFTTLDEIRAGYTFFATVIFNGYSQHFSTNVVVDPIPGTRCRQAAMTAGGGEYASLNPADPYEQTTLSNWDLVWVWLHDGPTGPDWYIHSYLEFGNRLFRFCPPCGPTVLTYARTFEGSTAEPTVADCGECLGDQE